MGPMGPVGLDDKSITNAMEVYFEVDPHDKLMLSLAVRGFARDILKIQKDRQDG